MTWFSFDGESFETHDTEAAARKSAEDAMHFWSEQAADDGWDEMSTGVCYGKVTHAVMVVPIPITEKNRHLLKDFDALEDHRLMRLEAGE